MIKPLYTTPSIRICAATAGDLVIPNTFKNTHKKTLEKSNQIILKQGQFFFRSQDRLSNTDE